MLRLFAPALLLVGLPASAETIDPNAYPELAPDVLLPPIIAELKRTLKDPRSVRDLVLCPATKVKLENGRPVRWSVLISFNAKNSYGAYEGSKFFGAVFRNGRLSGRLVATQFGSDDGLEGLINAAVARKMANCPTVSDEKLQQLLTGGSVLKEE